MKIFLSKLLIGLICVIAITTVVIAIPNILAWKEQKRNPMAGYVPDGAVIDHNGQKHLVIVDQNGNVKPYIMDKKGNFIKAY